MECYHTVYTEGTGEIVEKKSRFIAEVFPVSNEEEAFAHLEEIRKKHWDARHHCWAYVIGRNPAAEALAHTVIITKIHGFKLKIITDYTGLGKIQYILGQRGLSVLDTVYTDKVELTVLVPDDEEGFLMKELMEGTNGQAMTEKTEQCWFAETEEGIKIFEQ